MKKLIVLWLFLMYGVFAHAVHFQIKDFRKGPSSSIHDALHTKYKYAEGYLTQVDVLTAGAHIITRLMLVDAKEPLLLHKVVLCGDDQADSLTNYYNHKVVFATKFASPYRSAVCSDFVAFLDEGK